MLVLVGIALIALAAAEPAAPANAPASKKVAPAIGPTVAGSAKPAAVTKPAAGTKPAAAAETNESLAPTGKGPTIENCVIKLKQEVEVPGKEAGVLIALEATEGLEVRSGMILGHIDDSQPRMEKKISQIKHESALALAESDIDIRHSKDAAGVAKFTYLKNKEAAGKVDERRRDDRA